MMIPGNTLIEGISSFSTSVDGNVLAVGLENRTVLLCDLKTGKPIQKAKRFRTEHILLSPNGRWLAGMKLKFKAGLPASTSRVFLWDRLGTPKYQKLNPSYSEVLHSFAFSPDGTYFAAGCVWGREYLWRLDSNRSKWERIEELTDPDHPFNLQYEMVEPLFSSDGRILITDAYNGGIQIWDLATLHPIHQLESTAEALLHIGGPFLILRSEIGFEEEPERATEVEIWNYLTNSKVWELKLQGLFTTGCTFSPSGSCLAVCCDDGKVRFWKWQSGELIGFVDDHIDGGLTFLDERSCLMLSRTPEGGLSQQRLQIDGGSSEPLVLRANGWAEL